MPCPTFEVEGLRMPFPLLIGVWLGLLEKKIKSRSRTFLASFFDWCMNAEVTAYRPILKVSLSSPYPINPEDVG